MRASRTTAGCSEVVKATLAASVAALLCTGASAAQVPSFCEADLVEPGGDDLAYQPRPEGDRCEGRYVDRVSGSTLTVASVVVGGLVAAADAARVDVDWRRFTPGRVRLIVRSLKPRTFYRLDAAPETSTYGWSTEVLRKLGLTPVDLGYVAVADWPVADETLYVALRRGGGAPGDGKLRVVIVPDKRLDEVYLTVTAMNRQGEEIEVVGEDEEKSAFLLYEEALARGFYAAGQTIDVDVPTVDGCAYYRVEVGAALTGGGTANRSFVVHLPDA